MQRDAQKAKAKSLSYVFDLLQEIPSFDVQFLGLTPGSLGGLSLLLLHFFDGLLPLKQAHFQIGHFFVQFLSLCFPVGHAFHQLELEIFVRLQKSPVKRQRVTFNRTDDNLTHFSFRVQQFNLLPALNAAENAAVPLNVSHSSSSLFTSGRLEGKRLEMASTQLTGLTRTQSPPFWTLWPRSWHLLGAGNIPIPWPAVHL